VVLKSTKTWWEDVPDAHGDLFIYTFERARRTQRFPVRSGLACASRMVTFRTYERSSSGGTRMPTARDLGKGLSVDTQHIEIVRPAESFADSTDRQGHPHLFRDTPCRCCCSKASSRYTLVIAMPSTLRARSSGKPRLTDPIMGDAAHRYGLHGSDPRQWARA
jgi:hypothetical protein